MKRLSLLLAAIFAIGCLAAPFTSRAQAWNGRQASDLIAAWGEPQAVLADRHGGRTIVYVRDRVDTTPGTFSTQTIPGAADSTGAMSAPVIYNAYTPGQTVRSTAIYTFSVDAHGVIYRAGARLN